jgi:hypothetical protein
MMVIRYSGRSGLGPIWRSSRSSRPSASICASTPNTADRSSSKPVSTFEDAGFYVINLGGLREGGRMQQFGAPLAGQNLIRLP